MALASGSRVTVGPERGVHNGCMVICMVVRPEGLPVTDGELHMHRPWLNW